MKMTTARAIEAISSLNGECAAVACVIFAEADDGAVDRVEPVCRLRLPVEQLDDAVSLMGFGNHVVHRAYAFCESEMTCFRRSR